MRHAIQQSCLGYDVMCYIEEDVQDLPTDTTTRHVYIHQRRHGHDDVSYPDDDVDEGLPTYDTTRHAIQQRHRGH